MFINNCISYCTYIATMNTVVKETNNTHMDLMSELNEKIYNVFNLHNLEMVALSLHDFEEYIDNLLNVITTDEEILINYFNLTSKITDDGSYEYSGLNTICFNNVLQLYSYILQIYNHNEIYPSELFLYKCFSSKDDCDLLTSLTYQQIFNMKYTYLKEKITKEQLIHFLNIIVDNIDVPNIFLTNTLYNNSLNMIGCMYYNEYMFCNIFDRLIKLDLDREYICSIINKFFDKIKIFIEKHECNEIYNSSHFSFKNTFQNYPCDPYCDCTKQIKKLIRSIINEYEYILNLKSDERITIFYKIMNVHT